MFSQRWSVKTRLFLLIGLFAGGLLTFTAFSYSALHLLEFDDPYYQRVLQDKDLITDVLPPPQYIVEAYLLVQQMTVETESAALQRLIAQSKTLRAEYETRHAFWVNHLSEEPLKEMVTVKAYQPAMAFFTVRDNEFFPLCYRESERKLKPSPEASCKLITRRTVPPLTRLCGWQTNRSERMSKAPGTRLRQK